MIINFGINYTTRDLKNQVLHKIQYSGKKSISRKLNELYI